MVLNIHLHFFLNLDQWVIRTALAGRILWILRYSLLRRSKNRMLKFEETSYFPCYFREINFIITLVCSLCRQFFLIVFYHTMAKNYVRYNYYLLVCTLIFRRMNNIKSKDISRLDICSKYLAEMFASPRFADWIIRLYLVVAFAKCQRKKKNLRTSPVLVPMFIKPFLLLRREFPLQALLVPTFLPCSWP